MSSRSGAELTSWERALWGALGVALLLAAWQVIGERAWAGHTVPSATQVFAIYAVPWRRALLLRSTASTLGSAGLGLLLGVALGALAAFVGAMITALRPGLDKLAVAVNAMPAIALGPVLIVFAGRELTPVVLAAIGAAFLVYVAIGSGVRSGDAQVRRMFQAFGGSRWRTVLHLQLPLALPALVSTMKIAVTTAIIGTVIGEWFGAFSGLGVVILNTMQNFQIPLMWAAVLILVVTSVAAYGLFTLLEGIVRRRYLA